MLLSAAQPTAIPRCAGPLARPAPLLGGAARPLLPCAGRRQPRPRVRLAARAAAGGGGGSSGPRVAPSEADLYAVAVPPAGAVQPPPKQATRVPFYVYGPLAFLAFLGVMRTVGALMRKG